MLVAACPCCRLWAPHRFADPVQTFRRGQTDVFPMQSSSVGRLVLACVSMCPALPCSVVQYRLPPCLLMCPSAAGLGRPRSYTSTVFTIVSFNGGYHGWMCIARPGSGCDRATLTFRHRHILANRIWALHLPDSVVQSRLQPCLLMRPASAGLGRPRTFPPTVFTTASPQPCLQRVDRHRPAAVRLRSWRGIGRRRHLTSDIRRPFLDLPTPCRHFAEAKPMCSSG